jgi:hypothetical protein
MSGNIHGQLQHLSPLEKKLIQKISIFMTIVILPRWSICEEKINFEFAK